MIAEPSENEPVEPADSTPNGTEAGAEAGSAPSTIPLRSPRDGTPEPVTTREQLAQVAAGLAAGSGPVAVDAERASGYRYSQRAYLVQLRREGYGTVLIDPIPLGDLSMIDEALAGAEWILHAATQDLACLAEVGMRPRSLFDTELAGRLLGSERVALGTMVEQYLGISLEKGHSAADWSTRPLPAGWLDYAALDVELLAELRSVLIAELDQAGKLEWSEQEFRAILSAPPPAPRAEPWRRVSGIHAIRNRRQLAIARSLWEARDRLAADRDIAPGRVLPDAAIIAAAKAAPRSTAELLALSVFNGPRQKRQAGYWLRAISAARELDEHDLPTHAIPNTDPDAMPPPSRWKDRAPAAAARLDAAKKIVTATAERHSVVTQNLLAGDVVRRLCWRGADSEDAVRERLAELGARPWQIELVAGPLAAAFREIDGTDGIAYG